MVNTQAVMPYLYKTANETESGNQGVVSAQRARRAQPYLYKPVKARMSNYHIIAQSKCQAHNKHKTDGRMHLVLC